MLARLNSEFAYVSGLLRVVRATKPVAATPDKTLGDYLEQWAIQFADRPALSSERESFTYRELDARAHLYARWAQSRGLAKGDVVALMMLNRPEYLAIWFGLARVGVATALINTNLSGASLAHGLTIVRAKAAIVDASLFPVFSAARPLMKDDLQVFAHGPCEGVDARVDLELATLPQAPLGAAQRPSLSIDDVALFIYTSGTTGLPKAARMTHARVLRAMLGFCAAVDSRAADRVYLCLPMYHSNGGILAPGIALAAGASCFIRERFSASAFWSDVVRENCTLFVYIGELCRYLVNAPPSSLDRAHRIRACLGNGLRPDIFEGFQKRFGIAKVLEFYASTEGNAVMLNLNSRPGAIGRIPFWAARRFPMKVVAFDVETNAEKRDAKGHCIVCAPDEVGELIAEIRDDPKTPAARFDGYADPAATNSEGAARRIRQGGRLVPHRRPHAPRCARVFLFRRSDRRHLPLEGRERLDDRGRRDDLRCFRACGNRSSTGSPRLTTTAAPAWSPWWSTTSRHSISTGCAAFSPSACRSMRDRCSCAFARNST